MVNEKMNDAVVVVPTYNERHNLPKLVDLILQQPPGFDILVVDDNSPDATASPPRSASRTRSTTAITGSRKTIPILGSSSST